MLSLSRRVLVSAVLLAMFGCATKPSVSPQSINDSSGAPASSVAVHVIDVGEGDALLIQSDKAAVLVDTGSPIGGPVVVRYLNDLGIKKLDALILTHPHPDHMGGVFSVLDAIEVTRTFDNGQSLWDEVKREDIYRWYQESIRSRSDYSVLKRGDTLSFEGFKLDTLWPIAGTTKSGDWNNNSLVLKVTAGSGSALLMGDALVEVERKLVELSPNALKANLLKAGHHASAFTGDPAFLERVAPALIAVSVNGNNIRGYPSRETLSRYQSVAPTAITRDVGTIVVALNASDEE
jgi:competence protein ComEC